MNDQDDTSVDEHVVNDNDGQDPYLPLFTDLKIKSRLRVVDTSTEEWDIGESEAMLLNFNLLETDNAALRDQVKYTISWFIKGKSPGHARSIFRAVKDFLNSCEHFDESGAELAEALADELLYYFANKRKSSGEDALSLVRLWYQRGVALKVPIFQKNVGDALEQLKLKGRTKGLDILVNIPGKSPLTSNKLADLRLSLQRYADRFEVGTAAYWRLAATWLFITLGIRPKQLRLLMVCDFAVNIDSATKRKVYLLNVPSVKKRLEAPRSRFKSRSIPVFLGEQLEKLIAFNLYWLEERNIQYSETELPLFFSEPTLAPHLGRKEGAKTEQFKLTFGSLAISTSTQKTIDLLNKYHFASGLPTFDEPITPRRLRKTFATHAAACGTSAMMLMELLDHEDLQHVMIYYKLGANFAIKIDQLYREQFGTMFDYFQGNITLEAFSSANKNKQVFGPDNLRRLVGIGFCGKNGRCRKVPPYSCYTCIKFEACNDKQVHNEVLEGMLEDVGELFKYEVAPGKYEMEHINACRSLIERLDTENS
ncbi:tyrosine-type recombinase/integrase [Vibrio lentus]|uniref:tyrosine-type recombinase/integrase n=1 Tax=Vibrio lentus TaxID=136468 RepID=UPI001CF0C6DF|nr:tyrosine-type recombinase/integrase [Vibrio lentus]MDN3632567.1 tyrosine-type recombinase/integrase [Vibrio lentus]